MKRLFWLLPLLPLLLLAARPLTAAEFYRYIDDRGGGNVTNDHRSIPERYRGGARVMTGQNDGSDAPAKPRQNHAQAAGTAHRQHQNPPQRQSPHIPPGGP